MSALPNENVEVFGYNREWCHFQGTLLIVLFN